MCQHLLLQNLMQYYCDCMNLNGGYIHLDKVEVNRDEVAVANEDFPSKCFICSFISLQAQKQLAPNAKFACLDACNLSGKYKGMLICAANQESSGMIFILAYALVNRDMKIIGHISAYTFKMLD